MYKTRILSILLSIVFITSMFNFTALADTENQTQTVLQKGESYKKTVCIAEKSSYYISIDYEVANDIDTENKVQIKIDGVFLGHESYVVLLTKPYEFIKSAGLREGFIRVDENDNEITPQQQIKTGRQSFTVPASQGYDDTPYCIELNEGEHSIEIISVNQELKIYDASLNKYTLPSDYTDPNSISGGKQITIEAEGITLKSKAMALPYSDHISSETQPQDAAHTKLNMMGGDTWSVLGDWVEWNFDVPEDGTYYLSLRYKQDYLSGSFTSRQIYIDGKVPFNEWNSYRFDYVADWNLKTLEKDGHPYYFNLTAGTHTLRMQCTIGEVKDIFDISSASADELNRIYRKIIMYIGTNPDINRDYEVAKVMPDVMASLEEQKTILTNIDKQLIKLTGKKGSANSTIENLFYDIESFLNDDTKIPAGIDSFKSNLGAFSSWMYDLLKSPLELDYIVFTPKNNEIPTENKSLIRSVVFSVKRFLYSFITDYSEVATSGEAGNKSIEVWVQSGRDNANILRDLVNNKFTPESNISVNLKLVTGQLLMATMADTGPDVALQNGQSDPVNYAMRGAACNLKQFDDFDDVSSKFSESGLTSFTYNNGVYGLPETQTFFVMFYRKDILAELGITVPETWDELYETIGILQKNNLEFCIPTGDASSDMLSLSMLLYQKSGSLYSGDSKKCIINNEVGIESFQMLTDLYTSYNLPLKYDLSNRFRSGEIPLAIADYSFYQTLSVYAPEIRNLWEMALVPGTVKDNGNIDHSVAGGVSGVMLLENSKNKNPAWEFIKWYLSDDIQYSYATQLEQRLGTAARFTTANINVMKRLDWTENEKEVLTKQWQFVKGIPEIAGGYYTARHIENAFRNVVNNYEIPRETLVDYVEKIDNEITQKRKDLKLD